MIINFILNIALMISGIYLFYRIQFHFKREIKNHLLFQSIMVSILALLLLVFSTNLGHVTVSFYYIPVLLLFLYNRLIYKVITIGIVFIFYYFVFQYDWTQFLIFLVLIGVYQLIVFFIRQPKMSTFILSNGLFTVLYLILLYVFVTPLSDTTLISFFILSMIASVIVAQMYEDIKRIFTYFITEEEQKLYDSLTKLGNVKLFDQFIDSSFKENESVSILLIDIDNFKLFNDMQGYESGDELIKQFARLLKKYVPTGGALFRSTGEEFSMVIPDLSFDQTVRLAEGIRNSIEITKFHPDETHVVNMSVSIGIGFKEPKLANKKELLKEADNMLFAAKKQGQNRIMFAPIG